MLKHVPQRKIRTCFSYETRTFGCLGIVHEFDMYTITKKQCVQVSKTYYNVVVFQCPIDTNDEFDARSVWMQLASQVDTFWLNTGT